MLETQLVLINYLHKQLSAAKYMQAILFNYVTFVHLSFISLAYVHLLVIGELAFHTQ